MTREAIKDAILASQRAQAGEVVAPEGFKFVPIEPTETMLSAKPKSVGMQGQCMSSMKRNADRAMYRAMIEAAPPVTNSQMVEKKDAERYRWLRNESWAGYNNSKRKPQVFETVTMILGGARNFETILAEEALDEAIDAAIAANTSKPNATDDGKEK